MRTLRPVVLVMLLSVGGAVATAAYGPVAEPNGARMVAAAAYGPVAEPHGATAAAS